MQLKQLIRTLSQNLRTMSDSLNMVKEFLSRKTEIELCRVLVKMEGGYDVRLTGSKAVLIQRAAHAFCGLPARRQDEVLPGFHRARLNWQRARRASQVSRPPPPIAAAPPSRPPRPSARPTPPPPRPPPAANAATSSQDGARGRQPFRGGRSAGDVSVTPPPGSGSAVLLDPPRPDWGGAFSLDEAMTSTPIRRRRSRSMSTPMKLLEEYKTKWTCKVCLVSEVEVILQPCGHLCLCEPCSLSIRRHFFLDAASLKTMFKIQSLMFSRFQDYRVLERSTECYRVLENVAECYRVLQSVTEC